MRKFLIGFIVGVFFAAVLYFTINPDRALSIKAARLLDRDAIHMKDGTSIIGWILKEDNDTLWVDTEKGSFSVPRSRCEYIEKNVLLKYLREFM